MITVEFPAVLFSTGFPRPPTVVDAVCDLAGTAEPFLSSLCKVLAKSLPPCPADWRERTGLAGEPDDAASAWMRLVSTASVSGFAIPLGACGAPKAHAAVFASRETNKWFRLKAQWHSADRMCVRKMTAWIEVRGQALPMKLGKD
jgi:hypothetical protein